MWFVYSDNVYAKTQDTMYAFDGTKMESQVTSSVLEAVFHNILSGFKEHDETQDFTIEDDVAIDYLHEFLGGRDGTNLFSDTLNSQRILTLSYFDTKLTGFNA